MHIDTHAPTPMLAGLSPAQFMRRHWQKKPLLVRDTGLHEYADKMPLAQLLALAERSDVQSRCVQQTGKAWHMQNGPFDAAQPLPSSSVPNWTVLVQAVDTVHPATRELMQRFRFIPDARLDDVMLSYATEGGGVGPHVDSYDVFLLQVHGQRRWRISHQADLSLKPNLPLKVLRKFAPEQEWRLNPGDMLYLPPGWAHEGVAVGECVTASIGFRAPSKAELLKEFLHRAVDQIDDELAEDAGHALAKLYADRAQAATENPAKLPDGLHEFGEKIIAINVMNTTTSGLFSSKNMQCMLGEYLSEPRFQQAAVEVAGKRAPKLPTAVALAATSRMLYDDAHVFLNGKSWLASGADAALMRRLADAQRLAKHDLTNASDGARQLLREWLADGWLVAGS